jgi:hypothetical protein
MPAVTNCTTKFLHTWEMVHLQDGSQVEEVDRCGSVWHRFLFDLVDYHPSMEGAPPKWLMHG